MRVSPHATEPGQDTSQQLLLAETFFNHSVSCLAILDRDYNFIRVNAAYAQACRRGIDEFAGHNHFALYPSDAKAIFDEVVRTKRPYLTFTRAFEFPDQPERGMTYWDWTLVPVLDGDGEIAYLAFSLVDVTERQRAQLLLWEQANIDGLTRLPNRQHFRDQLARHLGEPGQHKGALALLLIDLDQFKEVNDMLGHDIGDLLLVDVAGRIAACLPPATTLARLGGDEFGIVITEPAALAQLDAIARDIIATLARPFDIRTETIFISASIGIARHPDDASTVDALLRHADQAMYAAKAAGRNRYVCFTRALHDKAQARMTLTNELRCALAAQQFEIYLQPIVDLRTGAIRKAEALLRWNHPSRGLVPPAEFIHLAEASGLVIGIGDWVFRQALAQLQRLQAQGHANFQISINVSPVQFQNDVALNTSWLNALADTDLPANSLVIEMTEGLLLDMSAEVRNKLVLLGQAGVQLALDDFGTGYSSLAYLKKFDIDYLKIDRTFVRNLESSADDQALCEAIIVMAHKLGLEVIAEGVETEAQRAMLAAAGCDFVQGYLYSRPLPVAQFDALLDASRARVSA